MGSFSVSKRGRLDNNNIEINNKWKNTQKNSLEGGRKKNIQVENMIDNNTLNNTVSQSSVTTQTTHGGLGFISVSLVWISSVSG
jgi:hypothetical protein